MGNFPASNHKPVNPIVSVWHVLRTWLISLLLAAGLALILSFPVSPQGQVRLKEGEVASRDIRAPRRTTFVSEMLTEQARQDAAKLIAPIYTPPDPTVARAQIARARQVLDYIRAVRADPRATQSEKIAALQAIEGTSLSRLTVEQILAHSNESWGRVEAETITVIDLGMRREIRDITLAETRSRIPALVGSDLNDAQIQVVSALATAHIAPNSFYDAAATSTAQDQARAAVKDVMRTYEAGQVVVREGTIVTALDIEALKNLDLLQLRVEWTTYLGNALLAVLATLVTVSYVARFEPELRNHPRQQVLFIVAGLGYLTLAKIIVPGRTVLPYLLPAGAIPMLISVLISPTMAVLVAVLAGGMVGVLADGSLELAAYTGVCGVIAALTVGRVERLSAFFRVGIYSGLVNIITVIAFRLPDGTTDMVGMATLAASGVAVGLLSAALAMAGLFVIGSLFDVTTTLQLLELARPTHPLLNQLLSQSTGTYHHTLMVANLAEQAAERIGANAMLTRVGALYHDVGKTVRPYVFVENQIGQDNVHERLDPLTSSGLIKSHIKDGLELARRYRLPARIRAFIPEHHGTLRASFLYYKALEQAGGDAAMVNERDFRYPGPKPQSRETALVMLADGCEAAVRAKRPQNKEELAEIIHKIMADRIADGQLDECSLTLRDLSIIRDSFIHTLQGVFHPRIEYPEPKKQVAAEAQLPGGQPSANLLASPQNQAGNASSSPLASEDSRATSTQL